LLDREAIEHPDVVQVPPFFGDGAEIVLAQAVRRTPAFAEYGVGGEGKQGVVGGSGVTETGRERGVEGGIGIGSVYLSAMMDSMRGVSWKNPISPERRRNRENEGPQSGTKQKTPRHARTHQVAFLHDRLDNFIL